MPVGPWLSTWLSTELDTSSLTVGVASATRHQPGWLTAVSSMDAKLPKPKVTLATSNLYDGCSNLQVPELPVLFKELWYLG